MSEIEQAARELLDCCTFRNGLQFTMRAGFHQALQRLWKAVYPEAYQRSQDDQTACRMGNHNIVRAGPGWRCTRCPAKGDEGSR